eukprot:4247933-Lingulodinium_polyedra.AAC.1
MLRPLMRPIVMPFAPSGATSARALARAALDSHASGFMGRFLSGRCRCRMCGLRLFESCA